MCVGGGGGGGDSLGLTLGLPPWSMTNVTVVLVINAVLEWACPAVITLHMVRGIWSH